MKNNTDIIGFIHGHNSSAALFRDGKILEAISEERFDRNKNSTSFPLNSINYIIQKYSLNKNELEFYHASYIVPFSDKVEIEKYKSFISKSKKPITLLLENIVYGLFFKFKFFRKITKFLYHKKNSKQNSLSYQKKQKKIFSELLNVSKNKIQFVDHHLSHIYTVLYGFVPRQKIDSKSYLIFSLDGEGDGLCAKVCLFENQKLKLISNTIAGNSIAGIYGAMTKHLGMKINEHEFKVMGLAAYNSLNQHTDYLVEDLKNLIKINDNLEFETVGGLNYFLWYFNKNFKNIRFDNLSFAIQKTVEYFAIQWIKMAISKYNVRNIALTGGFFMNIKVNKLINELDEVDDLIVCPSGGDESVSIGAAYYGAETKGFNFFKTEKIETLLLGYDIKDDIDLESNLNKYSEKIEIKKFKDTFDLNEFAAEKLFHKEIIARVSNKMEFGARALGNRSILANPSESQILHEINKLIKKRDFWMPFACSVLDENKSDYFKNYYDHDMRFMEISCDTTSLGREHLRAAIHPFDNTARPQIVTNDHNEYYDLIYRFKKLSGIGALLNTSYNIHGEPLVMNSHDALNSFFNSGLKNLIIDKYFITKKY